MYSLLLLLKVELIYCIIGVVEKGIITQAGGICCSYFCLTIFLLLRFL